MMTDEFPKGKSPSKGFFVVYDEKNDRVYPAHQPNRFASIDESKIGVKNAGGYYGYYKYRKRAVTYSKQLWKKKRVETVIRRWDEKSGLGEVIWRLNGGRGFHGAKLDELPTDAPRGFGGPKDEKGIPRGFFVVCETHNGAYFALDSRKRYERSDKREFRGVDDCYKPHERGDALALCVELWERKGVETLVRRWDESMGLELDNAEVVWPLNGRGFHGAFLTGAPRGFGGCKERGETPCNDDGFLVCHAKDDNNVYPGNALRNDRKRYNFTIGRCKVIKLAKGEPRKNMPWNDFGPAIGFCVELWEVAGMETVVYQCRWQNGKAELGEVVWPLNGRGFHGAKMD